MMRILPPMSRSERLWMWVDRHAQLSAILFLLALGGIAVLLVTGVQAVQGFIRKTPIQSCHVVPGDHEMVLVGCGTSWWSCRTLARFHSVEDGRAWADLNHCEIR